jgi:mevalonate kinase
MIRQSTASAPGKVILSGEHFVVHGSYSVAAAISKRVSVSIREIRGTKSQIVSTGVTSDLDSDDGRFPAVKTVARTILSEARKEAPRITFQISISSEIPPGSGLGSSSAVSVASAAALMDFLGLSWNKAEIANFALRGEKAVHGNPSGIDIQASLLGGMILFKKGQEPRSISVRDPFKVLVVYSGKKRSTSKLIVKVAQRKSKYPNTFQRLADSASEISLEIVEASRRSELHEIGKYFGLAQSQLAWIGVSNPTLETLIEYLYEREEVLGAKLTGAGGGGSVIAAIRQDSAEAVLKFMTGRYPYSFVSEIPQEGLRWKKRKN